jgi:hypothetical protein
MKKDIEIIKVEDLAIAIVPCNAENLADPNELWEVFLINLHEESIKSVLVASRGYGELDGEKRETSTLRYFWESIGSLDIKLIELIQPTLFSLANEFWVSFSLNDYLFDKKYVFVQGAIDPMNFTEIPFLDGRKGVMIR